MRATTTEQRTISLENIALLDILGVDNKRLVQIQEKYPELRIASRGSLLLVEGNSASIQNLEQDIFALEALYMKQHEIDDYHFEQIILRVPSSLSHKIPDTSSETIVYGSSGNRISARTPQQRLFIEVERTHDIVFAIGPAGTGKTYTAIALAVRALRQRKIRRLILTRPAVEAGERLGFLPGDLKDKLDPYLQPLYDALNDMMPAATLKSLLQEGTIQISPLAYMRGRTLDNAYIILDEAQNATIPQMKMFLTRLGRNAKAIITGDLTQIDLPDPHRSGLLTAIDIVREIAGIAIVEMRVEDIVRHRLVSQIVTAFQTWEKKNSTNEQDRNKELNLLAMSNTLLHTDCKFKGVISRFQGKVRDVYHLSNGLIALVVTDRISAFDVVLPCGIEHKGAVLNGIAYQALQATKDIVPNWMLGMPDPMVMVGLDCKPFAVEMIVRGYLCGSAWREYKNGARILCGVTLPEGMQEYDKFPSPIITPTTKAETGHDENISREEIIAQGLVEEKYYLQLERYALALFAAGTKLAAERGLILADTKYEFGLRDGKVYLIDEVHTPDSSRYFESSDFNTSISAGRAPRQLSKEFVRQWLMDNGFAGKEGEKIPELTESKAKEISERYLELYERLVGKKLEHDTSQGLEERIVARVNEFIK